MESRYYGTLRLCRIWNLRNVQLKRYNGFIVVLKQQTELRVFDGVKIAVKRVKKRVKECSKVNFVKLYKIYEEIR